VARQSPERRFHALYDRAHRGDVLREAWYRVKKNRWAAGVDRVTLAYVQDVYGVGRLLAGLPALWSAPATSDKDRKRLRRRVHLHRQHPVQGGECLHGRPVNLRQRPQPVATGSASEPPTASWLSRTAAIPRATAPSVHDDRLRHG
jgi:hypothetical protein